MKWGLQHVKVTLQERESGEVVVIEQNSDGRITCAPVKGKGRAANSAPRPKGAVEVTARKESPQSADDESDHGEEETAAEVEPETPTKPKTGAKAKATKKPRGAGKVVAKPGRRGTALEWHSVQDHNYHGFAAPSGAGQFKVLITNGSQWALFYELQGTWPKDIRCFLTEAKAKKHAQELHDAGWPESEFGPVTAGQVANACPAPGPHREQGGAPRGKRKTKSDEKEEAMPTTDDKPNAAPAAEPASKADAEKDKALLGSLKNELNSLIDEEDD